MKVKIQKLSPVIGAVVSGVDARNLDASAVAELEQAVADNLVVFLPNQQMTQAEHLECASLFGPIFIHPFHQEREGPEIVSMLTDDQRLPSVNVWHTDLTYVVRPPSLSFLYAREIPSVGGDTLWANMFSAFDALSEPFRELISSLSGVHDFTAVYATGKRTPSQDESELRKARELCPPVTHPLGKMDSTSGRTALYANPIYTNRIPELESSESEALLRYLFGIVPARPELTCRFRWTPNCLAIWDNRWTLHYGLADYYPARRLVERVTVSPSD